MGERVGGWGGPVSVLCDGVSYGSFATAVQNPPLPSGHYSICTNIHHFTSSPHLKAHIRSLCIPDQMQVGV